jgi:sugar (pentulose or hexulose) kinase
VRDGEFGIAGIGDGATPAQLWRTAVDTLVGVSARALAQIDALTGAHNEVVVAGGWLRNAALLSAKRRQFPRMRTTAVAEPGAYGAALLAASAAGVHVERGTRS